MPSTIFGVSLAAAKAAPGAKGVPLREPFGDLAGNLSPVVLQVPCFSIVAGGSHAGNKLAFREFSIIPVSAETFTQARRIAAECYHTLKGFIV